MLNISQTVALFQGREDDEPMTRQDVHGDMTSDNLNIVVGVNFHKKREEKKQRKYIQIGCIQVDFT
uniref:Uncharacterized protein n=1 Tax=Oryza rufipogon TaxID=4529 RepID=A0A0E0R907_ORYRU